MTSGVTYYERIRSDPERYKKYLERLRQYRQRAYVKVQRRKSWEKYYSKNHERAKLKLYEWRAQNKEKVKQQYKKYTARAKWKKCIIGIIFLNIEVMYKRVKRYFMILKKWLKYGSVSKFILSTKKKRVYYDQGEDDYIILDDKVLAASSIGGGIILATDKDKLYIAQPAKLTCYAVNKTTLLKD